MDAPASKRSRDQSPMSTCSIASLIKSSPIQRLEVDETFVDLESYMNPSDGEDKMEPDVALADCEEDSEIEKASPVSARRGRGPIRGKRSPPSFLEADNEEEDSDEDDDDEFLTDLQNENSLAPYRWFKIYWP